MNRITIEPFQKDSSISHQQEVPVTPRVFCRNRGTNAHANKLRITKNLCSNNQETINFDDTSCFREAHVLQNPNNRTYSSGKKCLSQILTVKMMDKNKSNLNTIPGKLSSQDARVAIVNRVNNKDSSDYPQEKNNNNRNHTSYSSRKYTQTHRIQHYPGFIGDKKYSDAKFSINKSAYNYDFPIKNKVNDNINQISFAKTDRSEFQFKKTNFFQYSIIKPDEIKPLPLVHREDERLLIEKRRKESKQIHMEMLNELKKREETVKRNTKLKQQIEYSCKKNKIGHRFRNPHTVHDKIKGVQQQPTFEPWEVQYFPTHNHFTDIL